MQIKSTRLRFIKASDLEELYTAIESLIFKVEVKGGPVRKDNRWVLSFVIPDNVKDFISVDLDGG